MGIKDRRRRRRLDATKYGDEETQSTEKTLTAQQTFSHVIEHEGALAVKGEQLLVLLTVCCFSYSPFLSLSGISVQCATFPRQIALLLL